MHSEAVAQIIIQRYEVGFVGANVEVTLHQYAETAHTYSYAGVCLSKTSADFSGNLELSGISNTDANITITTTC